MCFCPVVISWKNLVLVTLIDIIISCCRGDLIVLIVVCDMIIGILNLQKTFDFLKFSQYTITPPFHCHVSLTLHVAHSFVQPSKRAHIPLGALLKSWASWLSVTVELLRLCLFLIFPWFLKCFSLPKIDLMLDAVPVSELLSDAVCFCRGGLAERLLRLFSSLMELWALSRTTTICSSRCVLAVLWHKLAW